MDYSKPISACNNIILGLAVVQAQNSKGALFFNPDGTDAGVVVAWQVALSLTNAFSGLEDFDLVVMDVRGTYSSNPLNVSIDTFAGLSGSYPTNQSEYDAIQETSRTVIQSCVNNSSLPGIIEHVGTREVVQDYESIRKALGYDTINFLGASYGSYRVAQYAVTFPDRVDRCVLDAVVPHGRSLFNQAQDIIAALDRECFEWMLTARVILHVHSILRERVFNEILAQAAQEPYEYYTDADDCTSFSPSDIQSSMQTLLLVLPYFLAILQGLNDTISGSDVNAFVSSPTTLEDVVAMPLLCSDYSYNRSFAAFNESLSQRLKEWLSPGRLNYGAPDGNFPPTDAAMLLVTADFDASAPTEWATFAWSQAPNSTLVVRHADDHVSFPLTSQPSTKITKEFFNTGILPQAQLYAGFGLLSTRQRSGGGNSFLSVSRLSTTMVNFSRITRSSSNTMTSSETSPLLSPPVLSEDPTHWKRWKVAYLYGLFGLIINLGSGIRVAPEVRFMELAVCRRYYFAHDPGNVDDYGDVPEALCKLDVVQGQLAMLNAWLRVFTGLVGIFVATPYGFLADTKGRRLTTALSILGASLSYTWMVSVCYFYGTFQPEAIWWSSLFQLLGGGNTVLNAVVMAALSDVVPANKRTAVFFYTSTMCLLADLIAIPTGSLLLTKTTPNTAMVCSITLEYCSLLILLVIPETLRRTDRNGGEQLTEDTIPPHIQAPVTAERADNEGDFTEPKQPTLLQFIRDQLCHAGEVLTRPVKLMSKDRAILLGLPAFLTSSLPRQVVSLLLQYASKKLGLTIAAVGFLVSVRPAVNIVLFALILPNLSRVLASRLDISAPQADLLVAKISGALLIIGLVIIGLGQSLSWILTGLVITTLGCGFDQSVQLWLTSRVEKTQIGLLYSATSVVSTLGGLVEYPLLAATFSTGMGLAGVGTGLPFFVAGGICLIASIGVWLARLR